MVYKINYRKYEIGKNRTKTKEKCFDFFLQTNEVIEELCTVVRLCNTIKDLRLINCGLRQ